MPKNLTQKLRAAFQLQPELFWLAAISAIVFLLFYVLFTNTPYFEYAREIVAALLATVITAIVTAFLLKHQSKSDGVKQRDAEVFRRKVQIYDEFITALIDALADGTLSKEEAVGLRHHLFRMSLIASDDTLEIVTDFIKRSITDDHEWRAGVNELISAIREDLHLPEVGGADVDLEDILSLLEISYKNRESNHLVRLSFRHFADQLSSEVSKRTSGPPILFDSSGSFLTGLYAIIDFQIDEYAQDREGLIKISIDYPDVDDVQLEIRLTLFPDVLKNSRIFFDAGLDSRGFEFTEALEGDYPDMFEKAYTAPIKRTEANRMNIDWSRSRKKMIEDLEYIFSNIVFRNNNQ